MIKINTLLLINGIFTAFYAVILLFMPEKFLETHGMHTEAYGIFMIRLLGGPSQVGYAVLSIVASKLQNREILRLVAIVNFITWTSGAILFLVGKLTLEMNALIWMEIAFAIVFSLAFASYIFSKPKD